MDKIRGRLIGSPGWALAMLTAISTCGFIDRVIMQVLVQPIKIEFGLSDLEIGAVGGLAFAVLYGLLSLPVARLAERRPRIPLIALGAVLWSVATMLCGAVGSFFQLFLARVGVGVGEAVGLPASTSTLSDYFPPDRRTSAMAVFFLAPPLGAFIGSAGGASIAELYGWRWSFIAAALPGLLLGLMLYLTVPEPRRGGHDSTADDDHVPTLTTVLRRLWRRPSLRHILIGSTLASMIGFGVNAFLAAYLSRRFGFGLAAAGITAGMIASVPASLSVFGGGRLADYFGRKNARYYALLPALALFITAPLYMLAMAQTEAAMAIALLATVALVQYVYLAPSAGVIQNMMHPRMRASASALTGLAYALLGTGLGPLLIGGLSDHFSVGADPSGSGQGLAMAMGAGALIYLWAGVHYWLASRSIAADFQRPLDARADFS